MDEFLLSFYNDVHLFKVDGLMIANARSSLHFSRSFSALFPTRINWPICCFVSMYRFFIVDSDTVTAAAAIMIIALHLHSLKCFIENYTSILMYRTHRTVWYDFKLWLRQVNKLQKREKTM